MEKVLEFKNIYKEFNNDYVLEDVSFSVFKNDIFGFLGPNGAGKTTTIRLILDLLTLTKGEILINGCKNNKNNIRKNIGFCLDSDGLYDNMTAYDNLEFFDRIYNSKDGRKKRIDNLLIKVELEDIGNRKVLEFSKGMKKRLGIARALIINPSILILDEPLSGLDPDGQKLFKNIIKDLSNEITIFLSSHNLNDTEDICNRIAILNKKILICDEVENLKNSYEKRLIVKVEDDKNRILECKESIKALEGVMSLILKDNIFEIKYNNIEFKDILSIIIGFNLQILDIKHVKLSLEDIYFNVTGGEKND